jgi:hypothetical protein
MAEREAVICSLEVQGDALGPQGFIYRISDIIEQFAEIQNRQRASTAVQKG